MRLRCTHSKAWVQSLIVCLAISTLGAVRAPEGAHVASAAPVFSAVAKATRWDGTQFLRVDRKGHVFLVRSGESFDIFPLSQGQLGKRQRLIGEGKWGEPPTDVAVNSSGDQWAVLSENRVLWVKEGKQVSTPEVGWFATSVTFLGDTPAAAVLPMSVGRKFTDKPVSIPPLILKLGRNSWETLVEGELPQRSREQNPFNALFAEHTLKLSADARHRLWAAYPFAGRVVRFTPAGRLDTEIVLGTGNPEYGKEDEQDRKAFEESLSKAGYDTSGAQAGLFTAKTALHGMAVSHRDGMLYMVLGQGVTRTRPLLARYNSVSIAVETLPLRLPFEGDVSMAAGHDGLYIAGADRSTGCWWMSWESLDGTFWEDFPQAEVSGRTATRHTATR